jgi:hypothetical protein
MEVRDVQVCLASAAQSVTIAARIDAVDSVARTITLLGMTLPIDPLASIDDRTSSPTSSATLSQLSAGQFVEVGARWRPLGPVLLARSISILDRNGAGTPALRAVPDEWRAPDLVVLGRLLRTDAATTFHYGGSPIGASEFFAGRYATYRFEVVPATDGSLRATRVEVDDE